jgi:phosphatidylglycerol---prolipoprotein diacylglyceryl transferase
MHPVLFEFGSFTIYTYGFCIALGAILGFTYMVRQGKKRFNLTFDQCNTLFILLVAAGVVGGKFFIIFEDPSLYLSHPQKLLSGSGFVFYGSLLFAIPTMLWYFRKHKIPTLAMLDVMAAVTCIVHGFGRIGCFMAGCCYGLPTDSFVGVIFSDPVCQAQPLNTPLHPTQLYEAGFIFSILITVLILSQHKKFHGQLFLIYLIAYATGRGILELFRGDLDRGFIIQNIISNSQFISMIIIGVAVYFYVKLNRKAKLDHTKLQ